MTAIVTGESDPLSIVAGWVVDQSLDQDFRLSAASVCLPYLYPRLSASSVDARMTVTKVDTGDLLRRIDERIAKVAQPIQLGTKPDEPPLTIDVAPLDEDA